ncbi:nodulation protein NfeD [Paenibacillus sp. YYML68]|uniref:nodulation protein NfeD n=1 Tax=Paenibacillus sp. YYML68 TaxID=2909250 RepID=UPI0037C5D917
MNHSAAESQRFDWRHSAWRRLIVLALSVLLMLPGMLAYAAAQTGEQRSELSPVVVIPIEQTIETGLEAYLERAFAEAVDLEAAHVILEIDTLGGRVDSAERIGSLVRESKIPTVAYIRGKAISAGAYIALNANRIVMKPGSSIGAAAVVDGSGEEVESAKVISYWSGQMKAAAELRGRDARIAEAMVDKRVQLPLTAIERTVEPGQILTLTSGEALKLGYADGQAEELAEVLAILDSSSRTVVTIDLSPAEKVARFVTQPWVSVVLLLVGIAGIAIELLITGFGLAGLLGVAGFGLYFFGHYIAGFAGAEDIVLFVAGILLLVLEIFVSSFGILGILGAVCLFSGVVLSAYNMKLAAVNLAIAFVAAVAVVAIVVRYFKHRGVWNRFILRERLTTEQGYVSAADRQELVGRVGWTLTPLRPAGTMQLDEEKLDVVADGTFVPSGRRVKVIEVEGMRIVVREVKPDEADEQL